MALDEKELTAVAFSKSLHGVEKHLKQAQEATTLEDRVEHLQDTVALLVAYIEGRRREDERQEFLARSRLSDY